MSSAISRVTGWALAATGMALALAAVVSVLLLSTPGATNGEVTHSHVRVHTAAARPVVSARHLRNAIISSGGARLLHVSVPAH